MAHVLVVGGTGMLRSVSSFLADKGNVVSVIARNKAKLSELSMDVAALGGKINPISVDYTNQAALTASLSEAFQVYGPPQIALVWIRPTQHASFLYLAQLLNRISPICRIFHVCGPNWLDLLNRKNELMDQVRTMKRVLYRRIFLGYPDDPQRDWLHQDVISDGIIHALSTDARSHMVGQVEPLTNRSLSA